MLTTRIGERTVTATIGCCPRQDDSVAVLDIEPGGEGGLIEFLGPFITGEQLRH